VIKVKKLSIALALGTALGGAPIAGAVDYTSSGRVDLSSATYSGPGLGKSDLIALGTIGAGLALMHGVRGPVGAVPMLAFIGWGAWRTDKYRPQHVKDAIRARIAARNSEPVAGTVGEVLQ